jgi:hypothetical protein
MEWISVDDRLPETCTGMLVYSMDNVHPYTVILIAIWDGGEFDFQDSWENANLQVTHWMPLPSPPEAT